MELNANIEIINYVVFINFDCCFIFIVELIYNKLALADLLKH